MPVVDRDTWIPAAPRAGRDPLVADVRRRPSTDLKVSLREDEDLLYVQFVKAKAFDVAYATE